MIRYKFLDKKNENFANCVHRQTFQTSPGAHSSKELQSITGDNDQNKMQNAVYVSVDRLRTQSMMILEPWHKINLPI